MELPESIKKLTSEVPASSFRPTLDIQYRSFTDVISIIKQSASFDQCKLFEEGLVTYKQNINDDINFIKNLFNIYSISITKALQSTSIDIENKTAIVKAYKSSINSAILSIEAVHDLAKVLNKNENIIDVQGISYIILGYVTDTINKLNETRS